MKPNDQIKCKICFNYETNDRGLLNFQKKIKSIKKYKYNELEFVKICNCSQSHKLCILKRILVSQCLICPFCNETYKLTFIDNSSWWQRLVSYKFIGEFFFIIFSIIACIALLVANGFYKYSSIYFFWRGIVFMLLGVTLILGSFIIFKMLSKISKEKYVEDLKFEEEPSKKTKLKPMIVNNNSPNIKSKDTILQFNEDASESNLVNINHRDSREEQEKLKFIISILVCDFSLSKKEILQLKVEDQYMVNCSLKKDLSVLSQTVGSITKTFKSKETLKADLEIKLHSQPSIKKESKKIVEQPSPVHTQTLDKFKIQHIKRVSNDSKKMLILQDDFTQMNERDNVTTNIDYGISPNRSKIPLNTQDFLRFTSENSAFDRFNDNRELVLNISEDESFRAHKREIKTPFNLTSNESGIMLNQSKDHITH